VRGHSRLHRLVLLTLVRAGALSSLLVLDEFDSLISLTAATSIPTQASIHLLEALLSLPVAHPNVRVIAIANSLDLPSRFLSHLEPQPELLSFTAYDNADLSAIVRARLRSLLSSPEDESAKTPLADDKAIELVARRVQAENGDLRMCLDVCRLAIELVEGEQRKKALVKSQQAAAALADEAVLTAGTSPTSSAVTAHLTSFTALDAPRAGMPHVLKALQKAKANASSSSMASPAVPSTATFALPGSPATKRAPSSVTIAKIKATNIQSRLVLVALLVHSRRASWGLPPLGVRASAAAAASAVAPRMSSSLAITTTMTLHSTYHHLLSASDSPVRAVTPSDFLTIVTNLADAALISLAPLTPSKRRSATERKVDLACLEEEIVKGLVGFGAGDSEAGAIEEEARRILEREEARIERAREGRRRDAAKEKECPIEDRL
jgi:cell division control protein 6